MNDVFEIEPDLPRRLNWHVPWWLLAALGLLVAELTAHPSLGAVILCLKFGMNDWRTAAWLCKVDPMRARSATVWWFLVGSGFLKVFLIASIGFPIMAGFWAGFFRQDVGAETLVAVLLGLVGIAISFVMTHVGIVLASRRGIRVWINRQLHQFRDRNQFPPELKAPNRLGEIASGSVFPAILGFVLGLCFAVLGFVQGQPGPLLGGGIGTTFFAMILLTHAVSVKRVVASNPNQCWFTPSTLERRADD